jgi:aerobic-type carbon monoxide dehydrogenase small subunit (CoxS/CutS family)
MSSRQDKMKNRPELEHVQVTVNGKMFERDVEPRLHLGDFLRHELKLTGTHIGCEHGVCGACTVIVNDAPVRSCLMFAGQANGARITTVEGLAGADGQLHPVQEAFRNRHALQCGFCTPGMLMTITAFLSENPEADEADIRDAISGNICRCTGYETIVDAALDAGRVLRGET